MFTSCVWPVRLSLTLNELVASTLLDLAPSAWCMKYFAVFGGLMLFDLPITRVGRFPPELFTALILEI